MDLMLPRPQDRHVGIPYMPHGMLIRNIQHCLYSVTDSTGTSVLQSWQSHIVKTTYVICT